MQKACRGKVLVLGGDTRVLLAIARSLGRRGIAVHAGWCPPGRSALSSRYVKVVHRIPTYSRDSTDWIDGLRSLFREEHFDLVIPATDSACIPLQLHRRQFQDEATRIHLLNSMAYHVVSDKANTSQLAQRLDVRVPNTILLERGSGEDDFTSVKFPAVIKPVQSANDDNPARKPFVRIASDESQLRRATEVLLASEQRVQVQEYVAGRGAGVEVIAREGRILFAFQHVRLHETLGHGSTYRMSAALDPELYVATEKLLASVNYTGAAMVEFKLDETNNTWHLMEINGRFWGSLPLAIAAGADFPYYLYQMLVEGEDRFPQSYRCGVRCRNIYGDTRWTWRQLVGKRSRIDAEDDSPGWDVLPASRRRVFADWLRAAAFLDYADSFAWDDPMPAIAEAADVAELVGHRATTRLRRWISSAILAENDSTVRADAPVVEQSIP